MWLRTSAQIKIHNGWAGFSVEELDGPQVNPTEYFQDELEQRLWARASHPKSVSDLTNAPLKEWFKNNSHKHY